MKYKTRFIESTLATLRRLPLALFAAAALLSMPVAGNAQDTTSAIRGKILDTNGAPIDGATVVVQDTRSAFERSYTTNADGVFLATRLLPGGPYKVTVENTKVVDIASLGIGDTYSLTVNLQSDAAIEEIVTIGVAAEFVDTAAGPAATFNLQDIERSVAFNRDIADVYSIDPRMMVDNDEDGFGVNCAGKHPRFNNVTLDGVSQTDRFGLNENGYATAVGMPFPFDSVETIAVELAPFDVNYGGFSACNINAVTRSGTNDFEFKGFYEFSNQDMRGDKIGGGVYDSKTPDYTKQYWGFSAGGPIIQDKFFFYGAYAKSETPRFLAKGYAGSGNGEERSWLSQENYDLINTIASDLYNYDTGGQPGDGTQEEEKYLVRLDWNITDRHSAALIYSYFDGFQLRDSDGGSNEFEFANHYYTKGAELEQFTVKMTSQWTDALSTEIFYNTSEMNDSQVTVGPKDFADMQINIGSNTVYLGADDSRQANKLNTKSNYLKLSGQYLLGDHVISAGYDREEIEIYNLFVQHSNGGEYDYFDDSVGDDPNCTSLTAEERFQGTVVPDSDGDPENDECNMSGIDRWQLGRPSRIYYGSGGGTNDPTTAVANFTNVLNAVYIQDEIFIDHLDLTITAGLRYEWFTSDDRPVFNQTFTADNGFPNDSNIDGVDLLLPRFGFNWEAKDNVTVRGGFGMFAGGNPNVWISNAWSNDGLTNAQFNLGNFGGANTVFQGQPDSFVLSGGMQPGYNVPQSLVDSVLAVSPSDANDSSLALIDPSYKQPYDWKIALGATWELDWQEVTLDIDYLHSTSENPAYYVDVSQEIVGYTTAGSPIYDYVTGEDNFMLTNSSESPSTDVFSIVAKKDFDNGISLMFGYAYTHGEDVSPMTSSVAASNFSNTALLDINYPPAGGSNYVVPNRFTMIFDYEGQIFGDTLTSFTLFGYINEGQPQSWGMSGSRGCGDGDYEDDCINLEGDGFFGRHLLYVPTGPTDPNVVYDPAFDQQAFFDWISDNGLAPGFQGRNAQNASWSTRFDIKIQQEIPLPGDLIGRLYFKVFNVGNMLNDDWGKINDAVFFTPQVVNAGVIESTGQFYYDSFTAAPLEEVIVNSTLWEARLGFDIRWGQ